MHTTKAAQTAHTEAPSQSVREALAALVVPEAASEADRSAVANLCMDAASLGDPNWAAELVRLVAAWFARPRLGTMTCVKCGGPVEVVSCWTCRTCIEAEQT